LAKGEERKKRSRPARARIEEAPLGELSRDQLSVFLYVALLPEETRKIVKDLGLSLPGFRTEALGDVERCDVIADEVLAHSPSASSVHEALRKAFEAPPLGTLDIDPEAADELLRASGSDAALPLALWRVLSDRDVAVRRAAGPVLDELAQHYYAPEAPGEAADPGTRAGPADPSERADLLERSLAQAEERIRSAEDRAEARAEEARRRAEEQREKLQASLREARARESQATDDAARAREEAEGARRDAARLRADLDALRALDTVAEAQRLRADARELSGRLNSAEARLERALQRGLELEAALERARPGPEPAEAHRTSPEAAEEGEPSEVEATWLLPVYTREFYDSLEGWDRRVQRAAFKQAHLLALDHRHPSLRALPLEGLPGYYRVRVATDVRLIYRRAERQNTVEVLSLIDREDLDRYIRQAKTRG